MSQENVEVVRRYYEAAKRTFAAYWDDPRSAVDAVKSNDVGPDAAEGMRYLHPNAEWTTALASYGSVSSAEKWSHASLRIAS